MARAVGAAATQPWPAGCGGSANCGVLHSGRISLSTPGGREAESAAVEPPAGLWPTPETRKPHCALLRERYGGSRTLRALGTRGSGRVHGVASRRPRCDPQRSARNVEGRRARRQASLAGARFAASSLGAASRSEQRQSGLGRMRRIGLGLLRSTRLLTLLC